MFLCTGDGGGFLVIALMSLAGGTLSSSSANDGWCTRLVPVKHTEIVWKTKIVIATKRGWFGNVRHYPQVKHYTENQIDFSYKQAKSCCPDYTLSNEGDRCLPICPSGCPPNSSCVFPGFCKCLPGYSDEFSVLTKRCEPVCSEPCPPDISTCTAPDICTCSNGYEWNSTANSCDPICYPVAGCPANSICTAPDECTCLGDNGYRHQQLISSTDQCEPICSKGCSSYGKCVAPETCECFAGYELSTTTDGDEPTCKPHCSKGCTNGLCFAPDICVCQSGYLMGPNSTCTAVCSFGCTNGHCVEPEICECKPGYRMKKHSVHECEPICDPACVNGDCVAPNICICWLNYAPAEHWHIDAHSLESTPDSVSKNETSANTCVPSCPDGCLHGYCSGPFNCSCDSGYKRHGYIPNECVPVCGNCQFGDCIGPERCLCWPGYDSVEAEESVNGNQCLMRYNGKNEITNRPSELTRTRPTTEITELDVEPSSTSHQSSTDGSSTDELVTSTTTTTTTTDDSSSCWDRCNCWTADDNSTCAVLCGNQESMGDLSISRTSSASLCISLDSCECSQNATALHCNVTSNTDNENELRQWKYTCHEQNEQQSQATIIGIGTSMKDSLPNKTERKWPFWIIWVGVGVACLVIVGGIITITRRRFQASSYIPTDQDGLTVRYDKG